VCVCVCERERERERERGEKRMERIQVVKRLCVGGREKGTWACIATTCEDARSASLQASSLSGANT
jgi:hypothetical protein